MFEKKIYIILKYFTTRWKIKKVKIIKVKFLHYKGHKILFVNYIGIDSSLI